MGKNIFDAYFFCYIVNMCDDNPKIARKCRCDNDFIPDDTGAYNVSRLVFSGNGENEIYYNTEYNF